VFGLAHQLVIEVYRETGGFPSRERYGLTAQLRRSVVSVAANLVEGAARKSEREFDRYLEVSFGSLREAGYYLDLAFELGYCTPAAAEDLRALHARAASALSNFIRSRARRPVHRPSTAPTGRH
jgi:four helix bundle protein